MLDPVFTLSIHKFRLLGDNQAQRWAACYTSPMPDEPRPVATSPDTQYSLTIVRPPPSMRMPAIHEPCGLCSGIALPGISIV